jgi:hypothetical protein
MSTAPQELLSTHFAQRMAGRRLLAAVFTTFELDPAFFEQEVLPVFFDASLSHAPAMRLIQLEDLLRGVRDGVAVYYDANNLVPGDSSAKLDVARVPVRVSTGVFHCKNVLALVEASEPDEHGDRAQTLIVACMSANLTRSGWWENVEVAHVVELGAGGRSRLRAPLLALFKTLRRAKHHDHRALDAISRFVRNTKEQPHRSKQGRLHTHLWVGPESLVEFLQRVTDSSLHGMHIDVISPFFSSTSEGDCAPLRALLDAVQPRSCRVFLPKNAAGAARVEPQMYAGLRELDGVEWGRLPDEVTRLGKSKDAGHRYVHAKVYRFYSRSPKREVLLIGSPNLTRAAHQHKGNVETAFLVEVEATRSPSSWLEPEPRPTTHFAEVEDDGERASTGGTPLELRFDWRSRAAAAYWDHKSASGRLSLRAQGSPLFDLDGLAPREWVGLDAERAARIEALLRSSSLVTVAHPDGDEGLLLISEQGMAQKPSLLLSLSVEDILRFWSLLTADQRAAFIESRAPAHLLAEGGADLVPQPPPLHVAGNMFERFAGLFHAFARLEQTIIEALRSGRERDAEYRLFGQKYDSLGTLLERVEPDAVSTPEQRSFRDPVDRYLVALCAGQLLARIRREYPEFWGEHERDAVRVDAQQQRAVEARRELLVDQPAADAFLRWYEKWFLTHASTLEEQS